MDTAVLKQKIIAKSKELGIDKIGLLLPSRLRT